MDNAAVPISSTSPQPVEHPTRRWLLWSAGGVALLIVGISIGLFSAKFLNQSPSPSPLTSTPSPTLSPISSPDLYREPAGSAATADWKTYAFQPLQLSLKIPSELTVHTEEPNPGNDFTAYIQNYPFDAIGASKNVYQLYIIWQKTPTVTQTEFQQLKNDLDTNSVEDTVIAGYPAIKGQAKGERNRYVAYILKGNTKISLFTSGPTQTNENLTNQILSTFRFLK